MKVDLQDKLIYNVYVGDEGTTTEDTPEKLALE